jgi:wax ester synthase-like acyl-CoA acyltransferase family protein
MQQLTGLDAAFLALETANATGHVGGVSVLDPRDAPQPLTLARLTDVMGERLHLVPVLRRKLLNVPLGSTTRTSTSSTTSARSRCRGRARMPSSPSRSPGCTPGRWTAPGRCGRST